MPMRTLKDEAREVVEGSQVSDFASACEPSAFLSSQTRWQRGQAWSCDRLLCDSWIEIASHKVTKLQTAARLAKRLRDRKAVGDNVGRGPQKFTVGYTRRLGGGKGKSGAMIVFLVSCSAGWCPPI